MIILLTLGYVLMGLIFLIFRLVYHVFTKNLSQDNIVSAIREDCISLYDYAKQIVVSNPKKSQNRRCDYGLLDYFIDYAVPNGN